MGDFLDNLKYTAWGLLAIISPFVLIAAIAGFLLALVAR